MAEFEVAGLACLEAGRGGRPLLLVHGFCGAKEDFADHLGALGAGGWHAVAPDLRGHGESPKPAGTDAYSFDLFVDDLVDLVDALGWPRFVLLGHSAGGMVAQELILARPERVGAVVFMSTSPAGPEGVDDVSLALGLDVVREGGLDLLVRLQAEQGIDPLATDAHRRLLETRPGYADFGRQKALACSADMWTAMAPAIVRRADRSGALAGIDVPTLVIIGDSDHSFLAPSRRLAEAVPKAELALIAGAGHSPQFEQPDAWWSALAAFLASLPEPTTSPEAP